MSKAIWKYALRFDAYETEKVFEMPVTGVVVHVALEGQPGTRSMSFWVMVNTEERTTPRRFRMVGTGHPIVENELYCGTMPVQPGLVFHLVETIGS